MSVSLDRICNGCDCVQDEPIDNEAGYCVDCLKSAAELAAKVAALRALPGRLTIVHDDGHEQCPSCEVDLTEQYGGDPFGRHGFDSHVDECLASRENA